MAEKGSYLVSGKYLTGDDFLVSPNGEYIAYMQDDGNFVLYYSSGSQPPAPDWTRSYWSLPIAPPGGPSVAVMQGDGNFVISHGSDPSTVQPSDAYWATNTALGENQYIAVLQDDGNLVISYGSSPDHTGEIIWSALPEIFVQCKFMQNYRVTSPVNGGKDVVAVCKSSEVIELFTVGSDKEVHTFRPDSTSETGYNEAVLTSGAQAAVIGAGLSNKGKVVVYVASGLTVSYMAETGDPTAPWSTLNAIAGFPAFPKAKSIVDITTAEIGNNLYAAVTVLTSDNMYYVAYTGVNSDYVTFLSVPYGTSVVPHCFFQGSTPQNVTLGVFLPEKLALYTLTTQHLSTGTTSSTLNPLSADTALDATGAGHTFAVLEDHNVYRLLAAGADPSGNPQYSWQPLWLPDSTLNDAPVPYQEVVVEADSNGAIQVFTVSQPMVIIPDDLTAYNFLYHWTPAGTSTGYQERPVPIHKSLGLQLCGVNNNQGSVDIFSVDSTNLVTHLYLEQESGNWAEQNILDPANESETIMEYSSYATDITVYDGVRAVRPNVTAKIWASDETRLVINGVTCFISSTKFAQVQTNDSGILSISQETDSLSSPFLQLSLPTLTSDQAPLIVIQPFVDVQAQLDAVTGDTLMNAEIMDSDGNTTYLLDDDYRTTGNTTSMASAINNFMGDVSTPTMLATSGGKPRHRFWTRSALPAAELRRIVQRRPGKAWKLTFDGKNVIYQDLTHHEAQRLRAEKLASQPSVGSSVGGFWNKIGDALRSVAEGIAQVGEIIYSGLQATVDLIINGVTYIFDTVVEFLEDAFDMIELIFAQALVFFEKLYQWLAWLFTWKYILRTKDALAHCINQMLGFLQGSATSLESLVASGFSTLESQIAGYIDQAINQVAGNYSVGGYEQSSAVPNKEYDEASSNNFFYNEFVNNSTSSSLSATFQALATSDPVSSFMDQLNNLASTIEQSGGPFNDALNYFQNLGSSPDQIFRMLLAGLLSVGKGIVMVGLNLVESLIESLLQLFQTIVSSVQSILNTPWNIPFVSTFYKWVTKGSTLTTLDLVSLILAIPTTIFYKLVNGSFPFPNSSGSGSTDDITQTVTSQNMLLASGLASPSAGLSSSSNPVFNLSPMAAQILAAGYLMSTFVNGCLTALNDIVTPPNQAKGWRVYVSYALTLGSLCFQFPWFFSQGVLDCLTQVGIIYWIYIGSCLEVALAVYYNNYGLSLPGFKSDTMAITLSVCGVVSLALAGATIPGETDARKIAWRMITPIPMMAKFLRVTAISNATGYYSLVALGVLDYLCSTTAAVLGYLVLREGD